MRIPEELRQAVDDVVTRCLRTELDRRGLLLARGASVAASNDAVQLGAGLLPRALAYCYPGIWLGDGAVEVKFGDARAEERIGLALAFGSVTANLLTHSPRVGHQWASGPVELMCALLNLGVGLVDGLCDNTPELGLPFLREIRTLCLTEAARDRTRGGRLLAGLPASLTADPGTAFTAHVIEAYFGLLHSVYPGDAGAAMRGHIGARLTEAVEAESQSVRRPIELTARGQLIECSRQKSVLPLQIIEDLALGDPTPRMSSPGTLLGEAIWRIDDLVDLTQDAASGALNAVLLVAAGESSPAAVGDGIAALNRVLSSPVIPLIAAQAAQCLHAGLKAAPGGRTAPDDRRLLLSFVHRYAGMTDVP